MTFNDKAFVLPHTLQKLTYVLPESVKVDLILRIFAGMLEEDLNG